MLKDILIKCSEILGRDDIKIELKKVNDVSEISSSHIQNDVAKLISFFNFTVNSICEQYLELTSIDKIKSNSERKIFYHDFFHFPIKILKVSDDGTNFTQFQVFTNYLIAKYPNRFYQITYKYVPEAILDINSEVMLPVKINHRIICYGIVSEFYASKGEYNQSEYWRNRFLYEIYKIKIHKERRVRSTFYR